MKTLARYSSLPASIVALSLCALLTLTGCSNEKPVPEEIIRPVRSITIAPPDGAMVREFQGVVDAAQNANLSFRVSGKLAKVLVREGEEVHQGQVIAQLDDTDFAIKLKDRQASYDVAKADFTRAEKLLKSGGIARAEVETLRGKYATASAQLESARQELAYTVLKAPFSGRIAKRYVDNYEEVSAKQEVVVLQDISALLIKVELPENVLTNRDKFADDLQFWAEFNALPGERFPLTLLEASSQPSSSTQTYTVTFTTPFTDRMDKKLILPGMSARMVVQHSDVTERILVPAYSVLEDNRGRFVYVVKAQDKQLGTVHRQAVTTGALTEQGLLVTSGLQLGDQLVTAGMSQMTEGMKVRLMEAEF